MTRAARLLQHGARRGSVLVAAGCASLAGSAPAWAQDVAPGARQPVPFVESRQCGAITLEALPSLFDAPSQVVVRLKDGVRRLVGEGLADVNAACSAFWWSVGTDKSGPVISIIDSDGRVSPAFPGRGPRWLPDSSALVYTDVAGARLLLRNADGGGMRILAKPADALACRQFSDGAEWLPPIALDAHTVSWTYAVAPRQVEIAVDGRRPAVTVRVDVRTGRVLERRASTIECDYV